MKIVKDERLMIEGLKHIRLAFILQNIVILAIVFYRYVLQGAGCRKCFGFINGIYGRDNNY